MVTNQIFKPGCWAGELRTSVVFAVLMLAIPLAGKFVQTLGWVSAGDISQRVTMAMIGGYLVFTGNALPKSLIPLASLRDDPAAEQKFRRLAGWTWSLTGLALVVAWLLLPPALAGTITLCVVPMGMLLIALRWWTLPRTRRPLA